jgi:hypothetical protein
MKKIDSKLFQEFKGNAVSEVASVMGGIYTMTHEDEGKGCEDTWKGPILGKRTTESEDLMRSELAIDRGTYGIDSGSSDDKDPMKHADLSNLYIVYAQ